MDLEKNTHGDHRLWREKWRRGRKEIPLQLVLPPEGNELKEL